MLSTMIAALLALMPLAQEAQAGMELDLFHRSAEQILAQSRLRFAASTIEGEVRAEDVIVQGTMKLDLEGRVVSYHRSVRRALSGQQVSSLDLEMSSRGYRLREEGPLGARTRELRMGRIQGVVDPTWVEAAIAPLLSRREGFIHVLLLPEAEARTVEIRPRQGGARYLDLPGGGLTLQVQEDGSFWRLALPGPGALEIVRRDTPPPMPPAPPPGVEEEEVAFPSTGREVRGSLARAAVSGTPMPGVILLADAGPRDRNGDGPSTRGGLLRDLAHGLAASGYAVLRYEKRDPAHPATTLANLLADVQAAAGFLGERPGVDASRLAVAGHGEGGWLAVEAALAEPQAFAAVLSLAAPTRPLAETLEARLEARLQRQGETPEVVQDAVLRLSQDLASLRALTLETDPGPEQRLLKDLLELDPMVSLGKLTLPVLLLLAEDDVEVPRGHQALLRAALALMAGKNRQVQVLGRADHLFLGTDSAQRGIGVDPGGADLLRLRHPELVPRLRAFLLEALGSSPEGR